MGYSSYSSSLTSKKSVLSSTLDGINQISFSSCWSGSAFDSLSNKIKELNTCFSNQLGNINAISDALNKIDEYDSLNDSIRSYESKRSSLDKNSTNYNSDYNSITNTINNLVGKRDTLKNEISSLLSSIKNKYESKIDVISFDNYSNRSEGLKVIDGYKNLISSNFDMKKTVVMATDVSKYHDNASSGFVVTTGNQVYNLSDSDYDLICAIVAAESDKSYDDALAVVTTILNRCETSNWIASHGTDPVRQATAPNQFVVYQHGSYKAYTNGKAPDTVKTAVSDALGGVRNHHYLSFRSNGSTGYSNNMVTSTGNRYK